MELQTQDAPAVLDAHRLDRPTFEAARAAGLSVCLGAESTFNRQIARFAVSITKPLLARIEVLGASVRTSMEEIDRLKLENAELRQIRDSIAAPAPAHNGTGQMTLRAPITRFNDDDLYIYRADTLELIQHVSSGCPTRRAILTGEHATPEGTTVKTGMQAKSLGLWEPSRIAKLLVAVRNSYLTGKPVAISAYLAANKMLSELEVQS